MIAAKTSLNRAALLGGAATFVLALAAPTAALAQAAQTAAADTAAEDAGEIVVTGSLIKNPNLIASTPVNVTSAETIQLKASNVAEEVLRDLPGVVPSIGSAVNNGNGGASFVDLRGIGTNRNLVLLDGNRITPTNLAGVVDLNNIPLALVQGVETTTGAAVTTYGADAITGVVNFRTKQDFSGVDLQISNGITEKGDGYSFRADLTVGGNFAEGRGNAAVSVGYQSVDPVYQGARDFSADNVDTFSGVVGGGSNTAVPARFSNTRPFDTTTGRPSVNPAVGNGNLQYDPALGYARSRTQDPNGRVVNGNAYAAFNFNPYNIFLTPFKRFNIFAQAKYDVSDNLTFYTRGMFSKNRVSTIIAPSGIFGQSVTINLNNPFLPAGLRNQLCAFNTSSLASGLYTPRFDQATCDAAALATGPTDPRYRTVTSVVGRRTTEVGPRISDFTTQYFDYRAGLKGKITSTVDWLVEGSYGESDRTQTLQNYVSVTRARQSFLVNGTLANPVCNDPSNGCVATNWFGADGTISQASANFLRVASTSSVRTSLAQLRGLASGDIGVAVPMAADPIAFALGAEYRDYYAAQRSDLLSQTPGELGGAGGAAPDITGRYNVTEVYGELNIPVVQDKPFFHNLTVEAGARYSSYNLGNVSRSYDTFTWQAGGTWEITEGYKLRGRYSKAVRAPNIGELYSPTTTGLTGLNTDPCAGPAPRANVIPVCIAQGAPASAIGTINNPTAGQANQTSGGNINLNPETAFTWTIGGIITPPQVPGLSLTVDYYNIRVKDAVSSALPGDIVGSCFGQAPDYALASVNNPACANIVRNPATGELAGDPSTTLGLLATLSNLGLIKTDGIDLNIAYSRDIGPFKLGITGYANWTLNSTFNSDVTRVNPTVADRQCVGYFSVNCSFTGSLQPEFQSSLTTTFGFDWVDMSLTWRHISGFVQEPADAADQGDFFNGTLTGSGFLVGQNVDFRRIPAYDYFDLAARFHANERTTLTFTVRNLTDNSPPLTGATAGSTAFNSGNTYPSTYDALGRRYTMQINVRF